MSEAITSGSSALEIRTTEESLQKQVGTIESQAHSMVIACQSDMEAAAELARTIASRKKFVKEFFEPMRIKAKEAYDAVLTRKNDMMKPLEDADKALRAKMGSYAAEQDRIRRQKEQEMRMKAQQEANKKLDEAAMAEAAGDIDGAVAAYAEAEIMDGISACGSIAVSGRKLNGVTQSKDWNIVSIDSNEVPVNYQGMELRPVDKSAIMRLIRASKGKIIIPGVKYEECVKFGVRSR